MKLAALTGAAGVFAAVEGPDRELLHAGELLDRPYLTIEDLIAEADTLLPALHTRLNSAQPLGWYAVDRDAVRWLPPSRRPSKIVGVAINNELIRQFSHRASEEPAYFLTPPSALIGHREPIIIKADYGLVHPEPELAAIIGRRMSAGTPEEALDAVFGFTIINDVTSPGLKTRDSVEVVPPVGAVDPDISWRAQRGSDDRSLYYTYHTRSKGSDTFAPMGPWLVTRDAVPNPDKLNVRAWLGDEEVLTDSTANLVFGVADVLSHASRYMTLEPGDVVHFGTAARTTDPARHPSIWSLDLGRLGLPITIEIDGFGRLENPVINASPVHGSEERGDLRERAAHS